MRIVGFAGWSGSGKTTLLERLIALAAQWGIDVAVIKHAHHAFDVDQPGKDSWRHRQAGAAQVIVSSSQRWVDMHELRGAPEMSLGRLLARAAGRELVLVEGFKHAALPKIEIHRPSLGKPLLAREDVNIRAVATDVPVHEPFDTAGKPRLALADAPAILHHLLTEAHFDEPTRPD